jgi:hypothetical protein
MIFIFYLMDNKNNIIIPRNYVHFEEEYIDDGVQYMNDTLQCIIIFICTTTFLSLIIYCIINAAS